MKYSDAALGTKVVYRPNPGGAYFPGEIVDRGEPGVVIDLGQYGTVLVQQADLERINLDRLLP